MHGQGRGGSAYALWRGDRLTILVDMGADTPAALARAGASPGTVPVLLLSHLHADHVSGVPDFLWGEMVAGRRTALTVVGPDGNGSEFPGVAEFLTRIAGPQGAFPTLRGLQTGAPFALDVRELQISDRSPQVILERDGITVTALAVPHGTAPTLAYRLEGPQFRVVLAADQSGLDAGFAAFASGADVLVLHAATSDRADNHRLADAIGVPQRLGALARASNARHIVLSHLMGLPGDSDTAALGSLSDLDGVVESVEQEFQGRVTVASDLECLRLY